MSLSVTANSEDRVTSVCELGMVPLRELFSGSGLVLVWVEAGQDIPGSYWGEREAGLIGSQLFLRADTPVHSVLHEACHFLCMDTLRRQSLDKDAGGSDVEENAVCYLQCLLAEQLPGYSRQRCFSDMDDWGYHFVLGSAQAWFERDSDDAQQWLNARGLLPTNLG